MVVQLPSSIAYLVTSYSFAQAIKHVIKPSASPEFKAPSSTDPTLTALGKLGEYHVTSIKSMASSFRDQAKHLRQQAKALRSKASRLKVKALSKALDVVRQNTKLYNQLQDPNMRTQVHRANAKLVDEFNKPNFQAIGEQGKKDSSRRRGHSIKIQDQEA